VSRKRGFIGGRGMGVKRPNGVYAEVGPSCRVRFEPLDLLPAHLWAFCEDSVAFLCCIVSAPT
jgi:hypothetical protein